MDTNQGKLIGGVLLQSLHLCNMFHHLLFCCSSVHFLISFFYFVSPHPLWSSVCVCVCVHACVSVCVSAFLKKAERLWSINPLNAIKHTMHRRWPFNNNAHSQQTPSCSCAVGFIRVVDKETDSFGLLNEDKKTLFEAENQPTTQAIRPMSNVSIQF